MEISLCMIVKNEEKTLPNCLDSVSDVVDEIIIVDTGSTDKTVEIAKQFTDKIYYFEWIDDFAAARNFSFSKATKDYIMWLDADDVILEEDAKKIQNLKERIILDVDCVVTVYDCVHDEFGNVSLSQNRERFFKRSAGFRWEGKIHEFVNTENGNLVFEDIHITHRPVEYRRSVDRNFKIMETQIKSGEVSARDYYYYGASLAEYKRYDEALYWLDKFFKENKSLYGGIEAFTIMYDVYCMKKDYEGAYKLLLTKERLFMDKSEYHCCYGDFFHFILKDTVKACERYKKALKCKGMETGTNISLIRNEAYYYYIPNISLAKCYLVLNNKEKAIYYYDKALKYRNVVDIELEHIKNTLNS